MTWERVGIGMGIGMGRGMGIGVGMGMRMGLGVILTLESAGSMMPAARLFWILPGQG